ncbi:tRNA-modifying protein YgfZ [Blochmannia endosymbiont of Camponotus sp.]|uniref:tRNA-modifying protein YgfZ n=1 Tax=Blochmannia endosymbiont of Camponotus sp. TaxID=700220 RepID=UPI002024E25D|nr:tRNA-modifying protein YgfZ [Blochmannia endosymbiont of Camponotus sp.]URJ30989.1 tRNA-modifying protein YgfZ [Blochmannia endosymbiont of Camponotus sp.]
MLPNIFFSRQYPVSSEDLPLTFISLEEWILVRLSGRDVIQYLHNQFTCDIQNLDKDEYRFSAYCNPKGKMISNMYVFHLKDKEMAFIERLNVCKKQIAEMKKYIVSSNVSIAPDYNVTLIGIAGMNSRKYLSMFFPVIPTKKHAVVHDKDITILCFSAPTERFLLIINKRSTLDYLLSKQQLYYIQFNNSRQWALLDIEAGYPTIELETSELFVPQAVNMDMLQGVSFNKGCYLGQESIARIQYRGGNKKELYRLIGTIDYKNKQKFPVAGDWIELKLNNQHWKNIGVILQSCQIKKNNVWLQVVLNRSVLNSSELRITNVKTHDSFIFSIIDFNKFK